MGVLEEERTIRGTSSYRRLIIAVAVLAVMVVISICWAVYQNCQTKDAWQVEFESTIRDANWSPESVSQPNLFTDEWTAYVPFGSCRLKVVANEYTPRMVSLVVAPAGDKRDDTPIPISELSPVSLRERANEFDLARCL